MGNSTGLKQYYRYGIYSESPLGLLLFKVNPYLLVPVSHLILPIDDLPYTRIVPCREIPSPLARSLEADSLSRHSHPSGARSGLD